MLDGGPLRIEIPDRRPGKRRPGPVQPPKGPGPAGFGRRSQAAAPAPQGGSATPRPISPGDNAVYRIDGDGVPREVLRVKALVHALAWSNDRLLVGTGPEGQLYEVRQPRRGSGCRSSSWIMVRSSLCWRSRMAGS